MKILWFTNVAGFGNEYLNPNSSVIGGGWIVALENALRERVELHIAYYYPKYSTNFKYKGVYNYPICQKNWKVQMLKNIFYQRFIDKEDKSIYLAIINQVKPDLIHIHGTENPFGYLISTTDIPVVVSIQGITTVIFQKFSVGIDKKYLFTKNYKIRNSFKKNILLQSFNNSLLYFNKMKNRELDNLKLTKYIIGRTDWDRRITRLLAPESEYFHSNEIMREPFYLKVWESKSNEKLIIHTTSSDSPYKGFETLCHSLHLLNQIGIDIEWRVAGVSENDLIVKIVRKTLKNNFPSKGLILLGRINQNYLLEKLLEACIYVMPSHIENSPNSLCEAMLIGMPCIATFAGGTGSMLTDGIDGILIQDGDPWVLAGAILELKNNPEKANEFGIKARKKAMIRHNSDNIAQTLLDIYSTVIENGKAD
jgi:glycosyltransferase involved in cell wall biosynthesis